MQPQNQPTNNLTSTLNLNQLKQNITALQKGGMATSDVQNYVNNYTKGSDGNYTLKSSTPNMGSRIGSDIQSTGSDINDAIQGQGKYQGDNPVTRGFEAASSATSGVGKVASEVLPKPVREGIGAVGDATGEVVNWLGDKLGSTQLAQNFVSKHPDAANTLGQFAKVGNAAGNISGNILLADGGAKVADAVASKIPAAASSVAETAGNVASKVGDVAGNVKQAIKPSLTPEEATGQVIQGEPSDIAASQRTLSSHVDTSGVTKYPELLKNINSEIPKVAKQVDAEFDKDTSGGHSIKSFTQTIGEGKSAVRVNYVQQGIDDLKEYYTKTGDAQGLSDMKALENKAKINGLTYKDVNNLARLHGQEINAFNANGEAASGLSKQAAENTRTGLKTTARSGLGSSEAKALDAKLSDMYDTKSLIEKMVKKVSSAAQKTPKVGVIPKLIGKAVKITDTLTGSPLKAIGKEIGTAGGAMTPMDIESALAKNLKIIRGK